MPSSTRRSFLGAVTTVSITGCTSLAGNDDHRHPMAELHVANVTDEPRTASVQVRGDDTVRYWDRHELEPSGGGIELTDWPDDSLDYEVLARADHDDKDEWMAVDLGAIDDGSCYLVTVYIRPPDRSHGLTYEGTEC